MSFGTADVAHLLLSLAAIMVVALGVGALFARFKQPRVIGEIVGGLLLGPTLLGALSPGAQEWLFPTKGPTAVTLGACYQLGLLLLMFCSGVEIRSFGLRREGRTVAPILVLGTVVPFLAGLVFLRAIDESRFFGPAGNGTSFLLVFAIAMTVTSIPVIARIMYDLGVMRSRFARVVLGVAIIEDVLLYVVLAVAVGVASASQPRLFGLPGALGFRPGSVWDMTYHAVVTVTALVAFLVLGRWLYAKAAVSRFNPIGRWSPVAYQLLFMLAVSLGCAFLGIQPFLGAFIAGIVVGARSTREQGGAEEEAIRTIKSFSFGFFIPVYFALVGLQLNLLHGFDPVFFISFLVIACFVKAVSVYAGARLGGESRRSAVNLGVAMNARGGPGIVLASVAFGAQIIDQSFYATLVLVAVVTSMVAGSWLQRVPRGRLLAAEDAEPELPAASAAELERSEG